MKKKNEEEKKTYFCIRCVHVQSDLEGNGGIIFAWKVKNSIHKIQCCCYDNCIHILRERERNVS